MYRCCQLASFCSSTSVLQQKALMLLLMLPFGLDVAYGVNGFFWTIFWLEGLPCFISQKSWRKCIGIQDVKPLGRDDVTAVWDKELDSFNSASPQFLSIRAEPAVHLPPLPHQLVLLEFSSSSPIALFLPKTQELDRRSNHYRLNQLLY